MSIVFAIVALSLSAVKCDKVFVETNFTSTITETLNPNVDSVPEPACQVTAFFSNNATQKFVTCLSKTAPIITFGNVWVSPLTTTLDLVVDVNCTEKNCGSPGFPSYCQFTSGCRVGFQLVDDMGLESSDRRTIRFERNKTTSATVQLPHYQVALALTWQAPATFESYCLASLERTATPCHPPDNFCSLRGSVQRCISTSERCGEFNALVAQFDTKCPDTECNCDNSAIVNTTCLDPDPRQTKPTALACKRIQPSEYCPALDCAACRNDANCVWCNRGGDKSCVGVDVPCPSQFATDNRTIPCGQEPSATPTPTDPIDIACVSLRCDQCRTTPTCKFCNSNGDWRCIGRNGQCPSGAPHDANLMCLPKCVNDCAGHGTCMHETRRSKPIEGTDIIHAFVSGRPVCECDPLDGWDRDDVVGCRAWANRTVCTDNVINATMACQQESMSRRDWRGRSSARSCADAQITRDCMARAQAASCTFGQNTIAAVCNVTEVVQTQSAPVMFSVVKVPCDCTDVDAGFGLFCSDRACTKEHSEGGVVHFCQCVREHIACLQGHFGSLVTKCNASDPVGGAYAAICPDLCKVLPLYTAAPLPTTTTTTTTALDVNAVGAQSVAQAVIVAMTIVVAIIV